MPASKNPVILITGFVDRKPVDPLLDYVIPVDVLFRAFKKKSKVPVTYNFGETIGHVEKVFDTDLGLAATMIIHNLDARKLF